jgi:hypothetical protein
MMARARSAGSNGGGLAGAAALRGGTGTSGANVVLKFRNRLATTYRGTEANAYGDESDVGITYLTDVPVAIAETTDVVFDAATQRQQTVRSITAVFPAWADIIDTDTVQDTTTGYFYEIESMQARPGIGYYPADKIVSLRMRSGVSISSD